MNIFKIFTKYKKSASTKRLGQHADESPADYLRRVASNIGFEHEYLLDDLPCAEAVLDFHDLWATYDTDLWAGILEAIGDGADPKPAFAFVRKWSLPAVPWLSDLTYARNLGAKRA